MGVSIYYTAERAIPLTSQEQEDITLIISKYNASFQHAEDAESFDLYEYDNSEPETILAGATKMPVSVDLDILIYTTYHWLECLTEIRFAVAKADWHVHVDDSDTVWIDNKWQMEE